MNCITAYQTLPCPARLPDPSPIEHVWDMMRRRLHLSGNVDNLTRQFEQICYPYPTHHVQSMIDIECKRVTNVLLGAFKHGYIHHNAACRTGTRLKRRWGKLSYPLSSLHSPLSPRIYMMQCQGKP
ncbi:hypothetical protein TNCV_2279541 [Trichonephila clavipes]|uniref:Tc1-like transposase DDE domain-containing protein n=1 Tax=Trichonephila clavipes TaxID=2585209 RepID=A0A8X6UQI3_TRICX|nr:hypothetical protein TNCV_2279541 [Trichonephila clavipes]